MAARWVWMGSFLAGLGVVLGAFGTHGLRGHVAPDLLAVYETGVRYHVVHALALIVAGLWTPRGRAAPTAVAGWCFLAGIVLFSGSLYLLALSGLRWLGAVTPIGGVAFIVGWAALGLSAWRAPGC